MVIIVHSLVVETRAPLNVTYKSGECLLFNSCGTITIKAIVLFLIVLCSVPGAAPENVTGHNTSSTSIEVTWGEVPADKQHGTILRYTIIYKETEGAADTEKRVNSTARRIELQELMKYTAYSIQVLAATLKGDGPRSKNITVWTDQDGKYTEKNIKFLAQSYEDSVGFQPMPSTKVATIQKKLAKRLYSCTNHGHH